MKITGILLLLTLSGPVLWAELNTPEDYITAAAEAMDREYYDQAVRILKEAGRLFPTDFVIPLRLGDLYFDKRLYEMALEEYKRAGGLIIGDYEVLYKTGETLGYLARDIEAVTVFEEMNKLYPYDPDILNDLSWLYFKTYRMEEGITLLEDAVSRSGKTRSLVHTLATLYSGIHDYPKAKEHYLWAIEDASNAGRTVFEAIAWYNLSLLEKGFYRYSEAYSASLRSLALSDRAPGHLSLGELLENRLEFARAFQEYEKAYLLDSTPLAKLSLANLHLITGDPKAALSYLESVKREADPSWMYSFGTDRDRYEMDLFWITSKIYRGLANWEKTSAGPGIERVFSFFKRAVYRIKDWYYTQRFRGLALRIGKDQLEKGNPLNGFWSFYQGTAGYKRPALRYLQKTKELELSIAEEALPFYLLEEGKLKKDPELIKAALEGFDRDWEAYNIMEALTELIPLLKSRKNRSEYLYYSAELYRLNPGIFRITPLSLPVVIEAEKGIVNPGRLSRSLNRHGFKVFSNVRAGTPEEEKPVLVIVLKEKDGLLELELRDRAFGRTLRRDSIPKGNVKNTLILSKIIEMVYTL